MTSDYDDRREKIDARKIVQVQKEMSRKCHCGLVRGRHTTIQGNRCKKSEGQDTMVRAMTEKQINEGRFQKI